MSADAGPTSSATFLDVDMEDVDSSLAEQFLNMDEDVAADEVLPAPVTAESANQPQDAATEQVQEYSVPAGDGTDQSTDQLASDAPENMDQYFLEAEMAEEGVWTDAVYDGQQYGEYTDWGEYYDPNQVYAEGTEMEYAGEGVEYAVEHQEGAVYAQVEQEQEENEEVPDSEVSMPEDGEANYSSSEKSKSETSDSETEERQAEEGQEEDHWLEQPTDEIMYAGDGEIGGEQLSGGEDDDDDFGEQNEKRRVPKNDQKDLTAYYREAGDRKRLAIVTGPKDNRLKPGLLSVTARMARAGLMYNSFTDPNIAEEAYGEATVPDAFVYRSEIIREQLIRDIVEPEIQFPVDRPLIILAAKRIAPFLANDDDPSTQHPLGTSPDTLEKLPWYGYMKMQAKVATIREQYEAYSWACERVYKERMAKAAALAHEFEPATEDNCARTRATVKVADRTRIEYPKNPEPTNDFQFAYQNSQLTSSLSAAISSEVHRSSVLGDVDDCARIAGEAATRRFAKSVKRETRNDKPRIVIKQGGRIVARQ